MTSSSYPPISDYALIGDCASAALISRDGSLDWLCWPRFDSPSIFGALLDRECGGFFRIAPRAPYEVSRRYVGHTNVLETTFRTDGGTLCLTDLMPVADAPAYDSELWPDHEVLRRMTCTEGAVEVEIVCDPRFHYGRIQPRLEPRGQLGYFFNCRSDVLVVRSDVPPALSADGGVLSATVTLEAGAHRHVSLSYDQGEPAVLPLLGEHAERRITRSLDYWTEWAEHCHYDGPYRAAVVRSALTLKLMTFAASGAVVAAPTTSLPEVPGGAKNWDYRYCWPRDAAFTLHVLFELGYSLEGEAFFGWLLHATRRTFPTIKVLYDVYGTSHLPEKTLDHLEGYRGARPVRIGNEAAEQFQLDVYGELVSAFFEFADHHRRLARPQRHMLRELGDTLCTLWKEPDNGIWELRRSRQHHTFSKAMCWVALDRLRQLHERDFIEASDHWPAVQEEIRRAIETRGFNEALGSYVSTFDGERLDASLLLLSVYGYADPKGERMQGTYARLAERLGRDGLFYRFAGADGGWPREGTFGICSFWAVEHLVRAGQVEQARRQFEDVLSYANDVGLFAEMIEAETGDARGNFPQAFTHVGLINAALALSAAAGERPSHPLDRDLEDARTHAAPAETPVRP